MGKQRANSSTIEPVISQARSLDDDAFQIFVKLFMDSAGRTPQHLAERAFEAAEAFAEVAEKRIQ